MVGRGVHVVSAVDPTGKEFRERFGNRGRRLAEPEKGLLFGAGDGVEGKTDDVAARCRRWAVPVNLQTSAPKAQTPEGISCLAAIGWKLPASEAEAGHFVGPTRDTRLPWVHQPPYRRRTLVRFLYD
jgi:hypothetical protein